MGIVPVGYAVFAMALGIAAGALLRRTLPAIAVTLGGFIAAAPGDRLRLRPHYLSAVTTIYQLGHARLHAAGSYWLIAQGIARPGRPGLISPAAGPGRPSTACRSAAMPGRVPRRLRLPGPTAG